MDRSRTASSGEARLIRYESCATTQATSLAARRSRNAVAASAAIGLADHWFAFLVKIWQAVMPKATARSIASACPPAIDMCAPNKRMDLSLVIPGQVWSDHTTAAGHAGRGV